MTIKQGDRDTMNYPGDRTNFDGNHLVGPDFGDGWLKPVEAEYNPECHTTRIRFESLRKQLWPPQALLLSMQNIQKRQVLQLAEAKAGSRTAINDMTWGGNDGPAKAIDTQGHTDEPVDDKAGSGHHRRTLRRRNRAKKHR